MGYVSIADRRTLVSIWSHDRYWSQTIADHRRWSQKIEHGSIFCDRLRSSAITIAGSQTIADDRRSVFPYDRRRSQNFLRSAIRDPRSSAIIWKPAFRLLQWVPMVIGMGDQLIDSLDLNNRLNRDTSWEIRCWSVYKVKPDWSSCHNDKPSALLKRPCFSFYFFPQAYFFYNGPVLNKNIMHTYINRWKNKS